MRALLLLAIAVPSFGAVLPVSTEPFSVGGAALSDAEMDDLLAAPGGPYVIVGDRLVKVGPGPDEPLPLDEGTRLLKKRVNDRVIALRDAAREGRATEADKAEARALSAARSSLMALEDRWFLRSLSPELSDAEFAKVPEPVAVPVPGPAGTADPLAARLRARLTLDDGGSRLAREALDMGIRRLLESPTARELAEDFLRTGVTVKIGFAEMENSVVAERGGKKFLSGYGGVASRGADGAWVKLNLDYLSTDTEFVLRDLPATLGHELLGHALGAARAEAAGAGEAWNRWRGDELSASLTGWVIASELGRVPHDDHMRRWLEDPESYYRGMHLAGSYYASTFSAEEAKDPVHAYHERLARVEAALEAHDLEAADKTDWNKVIDHLIADHGADARRLALVRAELANRAAPEESRAGRERLLAVRRSLVASLAEPANPALAKSLENPFFAEAEARSRVLGERLRAAVARAPKRAPRDPADLTAADLAELYRKDLLENPSHWPPLAPR